MNKDFKKRMAFYTYKFHERINNIKKLIKPSNAFANCRNTEFHYYLKSQHLTNTSNDILSIRITKPDGKMFIKILTFGYPPNCSFETLYDIELYEGRNFKKAKESLLNAIKERELIYYD